MMNHDATHCKDFCADCPISCYRSELEVDLRSRWAELIGVPLSYAHLYGTEECKRDSYHKESIVEQKNDVVAEPTDLISRADAIEELGEYFDHLKRIDKRGIKRIEPISLDCKGIINKLPSADRPSGEWVIRENGNKECSLCGHERQDGWDYFCGYCGARMENKND